MKPLTRALAATLALGVGACDDGEGADAGPTVDAGAADAGPPPTNPAYLVASRIRTPSGRTLFVSIEPDLDERTIDLSDAVELSGFARAYAYDGAVFTMDSESFEVTRYRVDPDLSLVPEGSFSMAGLGLRAFRPLFAFLSPQRALYLDFDGGQVVLWDPTEMLIEETVPFDGIARDGFTTEATDIEVVGDRVFVTVAWTSFTQLDLVPTVGVMVVDAETGALEALLEDDRCAAAGGSFVDAAGDLYVIGDSDDGRYSAFGGNDLPPPCLLRIRQGADGFDPDYYLGLRALTGAPEVGHLAGLPDRTAVTRVLDESVDLASVVSPTDLAFEEIWQWVVLDLDAETSAALDVPLTALPFPPFEVDGALYVQREDAASGEAGTSQLFRVEGTTATPSVTVTGEILQLFRVR